MSCCSSWSSLTAEQQQFAASVAAEIVWRLSGRRFGLCETTVRPCRQPCTSGTGAAYGPAWPVSGPLGAAFTPVLDGGQWLNLACGRCVGDCSCSTLCEVILPGPVDSIVEVLLDGAVVDPGEYLVLDHRSLVARSDSGGCWPTCQDLSLPDSEVGTFSVRYLQGIPIPPGGIGTVSTLACEFGKACANVSGCRLPRRVQSVTREGVRLDFIDPMTFLDDGLTGLYDVDLWIRAVNPGGLARGARVYSPDRRPPRTVTSGG